MDSVFIFQSSAEETPNTSYDAIVVEQWTVVDVRVWQTATARAWFLSNLTHTDNRSCDCGQVCAAV